MSHWEETAIRLQGKGRRDFKAMQGCDNCGLSAQVTNGVDILCEDCLDEYMEYEEEE